MSDPQNESKQLSKNAQKKAKRLELIKEKRKESRKLKKQLANENKRRNEADDPERISKKAAKFESIERLKKSTLNENDTYFKICIDLQFEHLMIEKELVHLARQLSRVYGSNKKSSHPCQLTFANLNRQSQTFKVCCEKNDGFAHYVLNQTEAKVTDVFAKESIVYLTPDSDEILEEVSTNQVYVIGGLVDDSVKKHSTLKFAQEQELKTAKLPIEKFCTKADTGSYKQILTINQVFDILLYKSEGLNWKEAFEKSLPSKIGFLPTKN